MARKRLLSSLGLIALFAGGVGLGLLLRGWMATTTPALDRDAVGAREPAPSLDYWRYPGAVARGREGSPGFVENGRYAATPIHLDLSATPDEFDTVVEYYSKKCGFKHTEGSGSHIENADVWSHVSPDDRESAPLREKYLLRRCGSYDLTVGIVRARDDGRTRICLAYEPRVVAAVAPE